MYTFAQKKIARAHLNVSVKARELELLDNKIQGLMAQIEQLKEKRARVELIACAYKRTAEKLEEKYSKVKGSDANKPLVAKFKVLNSNHSGWLGIEYEQL